MTFFPDQSDRAVLRELQRSNGATVRDVCRLLDVTATAARYRLGRLAEFGLVERETVGTGVGRPHHVYRLTPAGHRELGENYAELAMVLWRAVRDIEEPTTRAAVLDRVRASMVDRFGSGPSSENDGSGSAVGGRFDRLAERLAESGFDVEVDHSGDLPILREHNCPYHELASEDAGICELEQSVYAEVLGTAVVRSACCLDGDGCCEFTVG